MLWKLVVLVIAAGLVLSVTGLDVGLELRRLKQKVQGLGKDLGDEVQALAVNVSGIEEEVQNLRSQLNSGLTSLAAIANELVSMQKNMNITMHMLHEQLTVFANQSSMESQDVKATLQTGITEVVEEVELVCNSSHEAGDQHTRNAVLPSSCSELGSGPPGYYRIRNPSNGVIETVFCDKWRSTVGWMRVAYLNMTDPSQQCPSGFRFRSSPKRVCEKTVYPGCASIIFPAHGVQYSRVCGQVRAYQKSTPDGFVPYYRNHSLTIEESYVDGISVTHGSSPRKHIWTFVATINEAHSNQAGCPCTKTDTPYTGLVPPFIGTDYFCDTGTRKYPQWGRFYPEDPLWDGEGCGPTSSCCQFNSPPWFCKELPQPTTDDIEVRVCTDQFARDEDTPFELIELYIQ